MVSWWEDIHTESEAWEKIIASSQEDVIETSQNFEHILSGYTGNYGYALDIGAGIGRLVRKMRHRFSAVLGVDISQTMVDFSKDFLKDVPAAFVIKGDGSYLPVQSDTFDFAYSYISFQHMHTLEIVRSNIQETHRVLKSGGVCRIQTVKGKSNNYAGEGGAHLAYLFEDEKDFEQLFREVGFDTDVMVGGTDPTHIWVTGRKS